MRNFASISSAGVGVRPLSDFLNSAQARVAISWASLRSPTSSQSGSDRRWASSAPIQSEWIREPAPQLRIVDDDLWAAVQARQAQVTAAPASPAGGMGTSGGRRLN